MRQALTGITRRLRLRPRLSCSFCSKGADEVGRLVAGPAVYICDECIEKCVAVLQQHGGFSAEGNRLTDA
jgi:hypothetical protein